MNDNNEKDNKIEGLQEGIQNGLSPLEFSDEVKTAFLDYAVSTLTSRAIPDARDGLKPVQRRIIYGMWNMGVSPDKPYKKSARITGEVMGKYHPHGNSSIYDAMARLAQPFAMRYPLVDGHGNFGSPDGYAPAAERYTEARLNKLAMEMTRDIEKNTVSFIDTYDSEGKEPIVLPSVFPNLLCNVTTGIAVGMATSIPPHNLSEVTEGIKAVINNPAITTEELMEIIKGPDFPDGGIIIGRAGIKKYFETGRGSIRVRSKYHIEEKNGHTSIVFTELPYMTNKKLLAKKIADLADRKVIEGIAAIADYSDYKTGVNFTIELKKNTNVDIVLNHLFKYTELQSNFAVNMLAINNGTPEILSMRKAIDIYINFQEDIITKRTKFNLQKAENRIHILEGFLKITDNIDRCIHIIRSSETDEEVIGKLYEEFGLDEIQSRSVLDMQLKRLKKLDENKFKEEKASLEADCVHYNKILSDKHELEKTLIEELDYIKENYGDDRRTTISDMIYDESDEDLIPNKEILIMLTKSGYIKRVDTSEFKTQNRGGIGVQGMKTKEDDTVEIMIHSHNKTDVLFFTDRGKVYRCRAYQIQEGSRTSKGIPVINFLHLDKEEKVTSIISIDKCDDDKYFFFATRDGIVKRTKASDFKLINSNGKIAITLKDNDVLIGVKLTDGNALISLGSSNGKVCTFHENDVRSMGRTAAGVKGINLEDDSHVIGIITSLEGDKIFSLSSKGYGKITDISEYRITSRGSKGVISLKSTEKNGELIAIKTVTGAEEILIITDHGTIIKTRLDQVSNLSRNTIGVKIITLKDNEKISSCTIEPPEEAYQAEDKEEVEDDTNIDEELNAMLNTESEDDE